MYIAFKINFLFFNPLSVQEISDTKCLKCMDDILPLSQSFSCSRFDALHNLVCKLRCRINNYNNLIYLDGKCTNKSKCACS